ncbi:MAG: LEA type 2 family protein [Treponema sp.]|jgi:LEA14-like dessication related protein|nr:LEA type 2 family protein [Treponema sp.]
MKRFACSGMFRRGAVLIAAALLSLSTCKTLPDLISEPVVSFNGVSLRGVDFTKIDLLARINVKNGNPFAIPFPETDWEFFISGKSFLSGTIKSGAQLAADSTSVVEIPLTVPYEGLDTAVSTLVNADEAPYRVNVGLRFPVPVLQEKTFKSEFSGVIPLLKAPRLSFNGIKFNSLDPQKVEFVLTWAVENKNSFEIKLDKLDYAFTVDDTPWARGQVGEQVSVRQYSLPPRKTTEIPVTVVINSLSLISQIAGMAMEGRDVAYNCGGQAALLPVFPGLRPLTLSYNYNGRMNLRR